MDSYATAEVCLNGHVSTISIEDFPGERRAYCDNCGEMTIAECPKCQKPIRGSLRHDYMFMNKEIFHAPRYCEGCGSAYPWTQRGVEAAIELISEIDALDEQEKHDLVVSIEDVVKDGPKTQVAVQRIKRLSAKAGSFVLSAFQDILVYIISETTKKLLFPTP